MAGVVGADGLLVLNADDAQLLAKAPAARAALRQRAAAGWFALDADDPTLRAHRAGGGSTCGVRDGPPAAASRGPRADLGAVAAMPLTVEGSATYNIANLAGAALAGAGLGHPARRDRAVFARFGASFTDNLGRMMRFERDGVRMLVDYAHNPDGLRGLLTVAEHLRAGAGRLGTLLGHAGNRRDSEIEALARVAAHFARIWWSSRRTRRICAAASPGRCRGSSTRPCCARACRESALPVRMSELEAVALRARVGASRRRAGAAGAFSRRARGGAGAARRLELSASRTESRPRATSAARTRPGAAS